VERGRWSQRAGEAVGSFSSSSSYLSSKALRMAAKLSHSQHEVWEQVSATQAAMSESVKAQIYGSNSPTSYQLSIEHPEVQSRKDSYRSQLFHILENHPDAVGYAFVINGEINSADTYGSRVLFRKLWSKLLDAAILEAVAESSRTPATAESEITGETIQQWIAEAEDAELANHQEVPPRVSVDTRRKGKTVVFDTCDHGFGDAVLHKNIVAN
jgi:hypothetical protein